MYDMYLMQYIQNKRYENGHTSMFFDLKLNELNVFHRMIIDNLDLHIF